MKSIVFIAKGVPNNIKSAGDIRSLKLLEILSQDYQITVNAGSADYGTSDINRFGIEYVKNNAIEFIKQKKPDIVILSSWRVAKDHIVKIREILPEAKIIIDTIDIEFLRIARKFEYLKSTESVYALKQDELTTYEKADFLITVANQDEEELKKNGSFKLISFPCIFQTNGSYKPSDGKNSYIICNWAHEPNIISTRWICEKIIPNINLNFTIVGKHPPQELYKYVSDKIKIHGPEYSITKFLSNMNMLLCPVFYGAGMNGKIGEALAFGIPVITTRYGAIPFDLEHKKDAMICRDEHDFIGAITEVMTNQDLRESLSINGKLKMENFTKEFWQNKILDSFKGI